MKTFIKLSTLKRVAQIHLDPNIDKEAFMENIFPSLQKQYGEKTFFDYNTDSGSIIDVYTA
jgi:hypothetical protein